MEKKILILYLAGASPFGYIRDAKKQVKLVLPSRSIKSNLSEKIRLNYFPYRSALPYQNWNFIILFRTGRSI